MHFNIALTGLYDIRLPQWGRCFWQSPVDGELFLAFASGTTETYYITSTDSGVNWTAPQSLFPVENFATHSNFDIFMDPRDHIHCGFRYNGSGCYKFLGKIAPGSGWTASSGAGVIPFCNVADTGSVVGFQGSITVTEEDLGEGLGVDYPLVRIAAKDSGNDVRSFHLAWPHNGTTFNESVIGGTNAGLNGGYPIAFNNSQFDSHSVAYYNDTNKRMEQYEMLGFEPWDVGFGFPKNLTSGVIGFRSTMAFGSGTRKNNDGWTFITSSSGHEMWGGIFELGFAEYNRLEPFEQSGVWPWESYVPMSGIYSIPSGTKCDFSFDDSGNIHMYFLNRDDWGRNVVSRFMEKTVRVGTTDKLNFSSQYPSGLIHAFHASNTTTGGKDNIIYWDNFKAAKHPLSPGNNKNGIPKTQFVVTQGYTPTTPSGGLLTVWDVEQCPGISSSFKQPHYRIDYTATSGTALPIFSGIKEAFFHTNIPNMFDKNVTTFGLTASGSFITMEFSKICEFDKIEVLGDSFATSSNNARDIGKIEIFASYDNSTYTLVGTIPSGEALTGWTRLRKFEIDPLADEDEALLLTTRGNAFSARYVKLLWHTAYTTSGRRISEIRAWGPASSSGTTHTHDRIYTLEAPTRYIYTEQFRHKEGTLPPGTWRTSGDYPWAVVASGDFVKQTDSPTVANPPGYDGIEPSGRWGHNPGPFTSTRGSGDGFSLRYTPNTPVNTSGVVEVTVVVDAEELYSDGGSLLGNFNGRLLKFDYRLEQHTNDYFNFYTINETLGNLTTQYVGLTGVRSDWRQEEIRLAGGNQFILRWVYGRGPGSPVAGIIGTAWIDNVDGLDGPPINGVYGFLRGTIPYDTGIINGYLNAKFDGSIHGYLNGAPLDSIIYGYLPSAVSPDVVTSINGYLNAMGTCVNGYLLCTSGFDSTTFPTGAIHGYVSAYLQSGVPSFINGYVNALDDHQIHGYVLAGSSGAETSVIHGYVAANNINEFINGLVNGSGENYLVDSIHGYVDSNFADGDQVINGYLMVASGGISDILGYTRCWDETPSFFMDPQTMIWGYLKGPPSGDSIHGYARAIMPFSSINGYLGSQALVASGGGLVGNPSTSNVVPGTNWIYGFVEGSLGEQTIHGYLMGPQGDVSSINGYAIGGVEDNEINGFLIATELVATGIHGYTSGVYWIDSSINGFTEGVSGIENSTIYGFAQGAIAINMAINGILIGSIGSPNSLSACPSHGFPLVALPTVTGIPTIFLNPHF